MARKSRRNKHLLRKIIILVFVIIVLFLVLSYLTPSSAETVYETGDDAQMLPLFAYGAVGFAEDRFWICARRVDMDPRQQFAVVQQKLLSRPDRLHQGSGTGNARLTQQKRPVCLQKDRFRQTPDPQFGALQVDQQFPDAGLMDQIEPVGMFGQRTVGQVHPNAGHPCLDHLLQGGEIGTGRADGSVEFHDVFLFPLPVRLRQNKTARNHLKTAAQAGTIGFVDCCQTPEKYSTFIIMENLGNCKGISRVSGEQKETVFQMQARFWAVVWAGSPRASHRAARRFAVRGDGVRE